MLSGNKCEICVSQVKALSVTKAGFLKPQIKIKLIRGNGDVNQENQDP